MYEIKSLETVLNYIEDEKNYFAGFGYVIRQCHVAREIKTQLWEDGQIGDNESIFISERIERAYRKAIETHKNWVIRVLSESKSQHTIETLVSTIYHDIFN